MGLFSSKKKVVQGIAISSLVDDPPDPIPQAVLGAILTGGSVVDNILQSNLSGFSTKVNKYLDYGEKEFTHGLPEGTNSREALDLVEIQLAVDAEFGEPTTVITATYGFRDIEMHIYEYLQNTWGYDPVSQKLDVSLLGGADTYYHSYLVDSNYITIRFAVVPGIGFNQIWSYVQSFGDVTVRLMPIPTAVDKYHVLYALNSDSEKERIWTYDPLLGDYPRLTQEVSTESKSRYYPIIPIRTNKSNLINQKGSELYKTSDKMLRLIGLDLKTLTDGAINGNDTKYVDDIFFMFGVNLLSNDPTDLEYLYRFWRAEGAKIAPVNIGDDPFDKSVQRSISIRDAQYNTTISFHSIEIDVRKGVIGKRGYVQSNKTELPPGVVVDVDYGNVLYSQDSPFAELWNAYYETTVIRYYKQITDDTYEIVTVAGPKHSTRIYHDRVTVSSVSDSKGFIIPINYEIAKGMSGRDESRLLLRGMKIVVYWYQVTKTKWYQSTFFRILLIIIAVVIAFYTGYWDPNAFAALTLTEVAIQVATYYAINLALEKLAELGGIFAVIAGVYALYHFQAGPFAVKAGAAAMPLAESLMHAVTMISSTAEQLFDVDPTKLLKEIADFTKSSEERQEELEAAEDMLDNTDNPSVYDPVFIMNKRSYFNPGESPTAYYNRTLETNPGVAALDFTSVYASINLALPTFNGLGGNPRGVDYEI